LSDAQGSFPYDTTYPDEALPQADVEFRCVPGQPGIVLTRVILDTGADASALPWTDCVSLGLDRTHGTPGRMGGVGGHSSPTLAFVVWVLIDGKEHTCRLQADFAGQERLLGRDVLNRMDVLFRGPNAEVVFNP
jgi:predicted aspartyl protease